MRSGCPNRIGSRGVALGVLVLGALLAACGGAGGPERSREGAGGGPAEQVLTLRVVTAPGRIEFDRKRLTARAGRIALVLVNAKRRGHNIRIHRGDVRGLPPEASEDLGGTQTISTGRTRAVLELGAGLYTYLCSAGAHWHTQHGRLVVR
jgi:plastocyanin